METKGLLIVVLVVAVVAGGLLVAFKLANSSDSRTEQAETTLPEDDGPVDVDTGGNSGTTGPADPSPPSGNGAAAEPDDEPEPPPRPPAARLVRDKPAPGTGAKSSGPRDQRLPHLRSTVSGEQVAQAVNTLETSAEPEQLERAMLTLVRDREKANQEFFTAMLQDESEDPRLRAQAATGLGEIGALEAQALLLAAMGDESQIVRARANAAFVRLTGLNFGFKADAPPEERLAVLAKIRKTMPGLR